MKIQNLVADKLTSKIFIAALLFSFCVVESDALASSKEIAAENELRAIELSRIWKIESINEAIMLFEIAADQWQANNESRKAVYCLNEAAKLTQITSDYETASRVLKKALKLEDANNFLEEKTISLSLSALIFQQKGDVQRCRKSYEEALAVVRNLNSPLAMGYAFFSAGMYKFYYGTIKEAISYFEKADSFARQTEDIQLISNSLQYVGFSLARDGSPLEGLEYMRLALQKSEEFNDSRCKALSHFGIGFLYMLLNEKQKALEYYKKSEELLPIDFEWLERAKLYNNFGVIYEDYGDLKLAEAYRVKAFEFFGKANYPFGQLASLPSLAKIKFLRGENVEARKIYDDTILLAIRLNDKFHLATANEGIGNLELNLGNYDTAIKFFKESIQTYDQIGIKLPRVENNLGLAFEKKGQIKYAKQYFQMALEVNITTRDLLPATENLFNLARISFLERNFDVALEQIRKSISITESLYSDVLNSKLKRDYFSNNLDHYELLVNLLMNKHGQHPRENYDTEALQAAERSRARAMLENLSLSEAEFFKDADAEIVGRGKEIRVMLNAKADKLTDLLSQKAEKTVIETISNEINELEHELEDIRAKLKQNSPVYSAITNPEPFDVVEFQKNLLDDDSLLLEFSLGNEESYLWLVGKNEFNSFVLPPRREIEKHIENLRELLKDRAERSGESIEDFQARVNDADLRYKAEVKELSNKLLGPVADKLANKRLIIVPDGKLRYFPIAALPLPNSVSDEPILVTNETIYEPSAQALAFFSKTSLQTRSSAKYLAVFSDPVFSSDDSRLPNKNAFAENLKTEESNVEQFRFVDSLNNLPRLYGSDIEGAAIVNIFGRSVAESFSGFSATREKVLSPDISSYGVIHFATHGLVNEEHPELSGIVLSGYDEKGEKLEQVVRLQDIYGMNLNADLVVLSACETGVGKDVKGEGLQSLTNAFLSVGAKTVVSTLWKVEDSATLELMRTFYNSLADGKTTPSMALRDAQIKLRQNPRYKSPLYWAAFTIQGDFQRTAHVRPGSFITSPTGLGILLLILAIAFSAFFVLRSKKA